MKRRTVVGLHIVKENVVDPYSGAVFQFPKTLCAVSEQGHLTTDCQEQRVFSRNQEKVKLKSAEGQGVGSSNTHNKHGVI